MRIKSLVINDVTYSVEYLDEVKLYREFVNGVCDTRLKHIQIDRRHSAEMLKWILLHEMIHAVVKENEIDIDEAQEELLCDAIADAMKGNFEIRRKKQARKA